MSAILEYSISPSFPVWKIIQVFEHILIAPVYRDERTWPRRTDSEYQVQQATRFVCSDFITDTAHR